MCGMIQVMACQQTLETYPEFTVKDCVDHRIESGIQITKPKYDTPDDVVQLDLQTVYQRKSEPTENETPGYNGNLKFSNKLSFLQIVRLTVLAALISKDNLFSYAPAVRFFCPRRIK